MSLPSHLPHVDGVRHRFIGANGIVHHVAEAGAERRRSRPPPARLAAALVRVAPPDPGARRAPPRPRPRPARLRLVRRAADAATRRSSSPPTCSPSSTRSGSTASSSSATTGAAGSASCSACARPERFDRFLALGITHPWQTVGGGWRDLPRFWYQLPIITPGLGYALHRSGLLVRAALRGGDRPTATPSTRSRSPSFADNLAEPARARACVQVYRDLRPPRAVRG